MFLGSLHSNLYYFVFYMSIIFHFRYKHLKNYHFDNLNPMWVDRKIIRFTKILTWNVTQQGLFFNIIPLAIHTLLLWLLDPMDQNCHQQQIWCDGINFSAHPNTYIYASTTRVFDIWDSAYDTEIKYCN